MVCLVAADLHGAFLRDSGPNHIANRRAPQIMDQQSRDTGTFARLFPCRFYFSDAVALPGNNERAVRLACGVGHLEPRSQLAIERRIACPFSLRLLLL